MTREAKIGMLTGLGVIVLIGVLLSEYLGNGVGTNSATGHMAELPMGVAYRNQLTEPVGVPGLARADGANESTPASAPASTLIIAAKNPETLSMEAPSMSSPAGPVVNSPVTPTSAGQVPTTPTNNAGSVPTIQVADANGHGTDAVYVPQTGDSAGANTSKMVMVGTVKEETPAVEGKPYVIAKGDTLSRIAKKFYKSATAADMDRIVAANPKMLKDDKSMLVVGKTLTIPAAPITAATVPTTPTPTVATKNSAAKSVIIHPPGATNASAKKDADAPAAKTASTQVYVIASGDTLEKIAKKLSPSHVTDMVKQLRTLNGIKDDSSLKIGQKLKLPA